MSRLETVSNHATTDGVTAAVRYKQSEEDDTEHRFGIGMVEGWRGEVLVALHSGRDKRIARMHPYDPSWQNWPLLEHAIIGNIVPDFPLINKSFNLSYTGQDL